jgi:hypothetical protein
MFNSSACSYNLSNSVSNDHSPYDSFIPRRIILLIHTALKWNNIGIAIRGVDEKGYGLSSTVPPFQSPFAVGMTLNVITSNIIGTDTTLCNVLLHLSFVHLSISASNHPN